MLQLVGSPQSHRGTLPTIRASLGYRRRDTRPPLSHVGAPFFRAVQETCCRTQVLPVVARFRPQSFPSRSAPDHAPILTLFAGVLGHAYPALYVAPKLVNPFPYSSYLFEHRAELNLFRLQAVLPRPVPKPGDTAFGHFSPPTLQLVFHEKRFARFGHYART